MVQNLQATLRSKIIQMETTLGQQNKATNYMDDVAVDITGLTKSSYIRMAAKEDLDETECSSSFANTTSGNENCSGPSDAEVESQFYDDSGLASSFDGFSSLFPMRKRKLTAHWRSFIGPLMWRCKWTELRIKEFESQVSRYAREMATLDQKKHKAADQNFLEEFGSRSQPFINQGHRKKSMNRRKRKRAEQTTDILSYMSNHHLFSYSENKRSDLDGTSAGDDFGNLGSTEQVTAGCDEFATNDDLSNLEENDNFPEQILRKIDAVHIRVQQLKAQLDTLMNKNAIKFSSSENLSHLVSCDAQTSSARSPTFSACHGDTVSVGGLYAPTQHTLDYDFGDFVMPDTAISNYGEGIAIPDIIESTVGLLSSADVTEHEAQIGDCCEKILDNILIHNEVAEVERQILQMNYSPSTEQHQEIETSGEAESTNPPLPVSIQNAVTKVGGSQEQSALKSCLASEIHFPKNKRKRGERKAGSGGWSRQCPGEPDSQ